MSRNNRPNKKETNEPISDQYVQNSAPIRIWSSFEEFWFSCIKGQDYFLMESCKEHLKALGWYDSQSKWLDGAKHFGIPIEKDRK
jgi:hypothetical protein